MKKPMPFSDKRWACPHCNYSVAPEMERTVKKHFDAHSLQCVRCLYRTETKATWAEAEAAYRTRYEPKMPPCSHEAIIGLDGKWHCQRCGNAIEMGAAHSASQQHSAQGE